MNESPRVSPILSLLITEPCRECGQPVRPKPGAEIKQSGSFAGEFAINPGEPPEGWPVVTIAIDIRCENGHIEERRGWQLISP